MRQGWIKLHRQLADNELWLSEKFTKGQAWIDLVLHANHKRRMMDIRGNVIYIERGQLGWSELTMAKRWKWSKNKVRRFLKLLETIQQIEQQKDRYITTIITILNYEKYQNDTADDTAERQQKDSRRYINKNDKNDKNVKNIIVEQNNDLNNLLLKYIPIRDIGNKTNQTYLKRLFNHYNKDINKIKALCRAVNYFSKSDYPYTIYSVKSLYDKVDKIEARIVQEKGRLNKNKIIKI